MWSRTSENGRFKFILIVAPIRDLETKRHSSARLSCCGLSGPWGQPALWVFQYGSVLLFPLVEIAVWVRMGFGVAVGKTVGFRPFSV